jgi:phospholipase/carboxylesterase
MLSGAPSRFCIHNPGRSKAPLIFLHGSASRPHGWIQDWQEFEKGLANDSPHIFLRGHHCESDGYTFVRRNPDHSLNQVEIDADAKGCVSALRNILETTQMTDQRPLLVGYSSGAVFAAALVHQQPELFGGGILLRPQTPFDDASGIAWPSLASLPFLLLSGAHDHRRAPEDAPHLARQLTEAGASVTHHRLDTGHAWEQNGLDTKLSREWLERFVSQEPRSPELHTETP